MTGARLADLIRSLAEAAEDVEDTGEAVEAAEAAEATAEAEDAFGNCTIPQVSMVLSVVEFQVWCYKTR